MVGGADDDGVIGLLNLRSLDGKSKGMPIKKELKEVDTLADE